MILAAVLVPLQPTQYGLQAHAEQVPAENMDVHAAVGGPNHSMTLMMAGVDSSMSTGTDSSMNTGNGSSDNGENYATMENTPLSKASDNVTVDFTADPVIQANQLASIQMNVKDTASGSKLSHVDWAITVKNPDGNIVYKTTTGHSHVGNMNFKVAFLEAGENTVYLTTSSIGNMMMGLEPTHKGWTHTMLSGSLKGAAKDPLNNFGSRTFTFPVYVQRIDQKHTLQGTVPGTAINLDMSTLSDKIEAGQPVTFVFTATKAQDDSMVTHPDMQVTIKTGNFIVAQSAAVENPLAMSGAVHGHTGVEEVTEIFPSAGHYILDIDIQPSSLSNYVWGNVNTRYDVFVSEPMGNVATQTTDTSGNIPPNTVNIVGLEAPFFTPNSLDIKVGTTVTFVNTDGNSHTVTSVKPGTTDSDGTFDSGIIKPGKTFTFTFSKPGTYEYICMIHTHMRGTINVS
jgi:plastocyanin